MLFTKTAESGLSPKEATTYYDFSKWLFVLVGIYFIIFVFVFF